MFDSLSFPAGNPKKMDHLTSLDGAKESLHLFKADLLEEGAFDAIVDGCESAFHTASPFYYAIKDPQVVVMIDSIKRKELLCISR
ncbi:Dihydroflavonol-4-reductase [Capsicum chinense]|nr:Dihydroflavonol-4-reductase [Capsicum chinense]